MSDDPKAPKVAITKHEVNLDPHLSVFNVVLENEGGIWTESWGTEGELRAFVRGVRAACHMMGAIIPQPELPENFSSRFVEDLPGPH